MPFRSTISRPLGLALLAFAISRFYFYGCFSAGASDVEIYFRYAAAGVDHGKVPYRDIPEVEYPPVAFWTMCLPRLVMPERFASNTVDTATFARQLQQYDVLFRGCMLAFDLASMAFFIAILKRRAPERLVAGVWTFTLATSFLGYVLFERLDVGLTCSLTCWAYATLRADDKNGPTTLWRIIGNAALGLGVSYKLIPIVIVPFALLNDGFGWLRHPRDWRRLLGPLTLTAAALGPYAYYYAIVGDDLGNMFRYHADRGIEIESIYATLMMVTHGPSALEPYFDFGSWNLGGAWERKLTSLSTPLLAVTLFAFGLRALVQAVRGKFDGTAAYRAACLVIPTAVLLAKVLSVQYLCWALPMLVLAAAELPCRSTFRTICFASVVATAMTGFLYPYHFVSGMDIFPYSRESPPPWTLVEHSRWTVRNDRDLLVGRLSNYGPPWWAMTLRNMIYAACVVQVIASPRRRCGSAASTQQGDCDNIANKPGSVRQCAADQHEG